MKNIYRPQRSCEGYVFTGVCLSTGGGWGCLPQCMLGYHTPPADTPWSRHPLGADTPQEQRTPGSRHPPWSRHPQGADTPRSRLPRPDTPRTRHPEDQTPPQETPPCSRHPPRADTPLEQTPPRADTPSQIRPLLRTVGILLECILVTSCSCFH